MCLVEEGIEGVEEGTVLVFRHTFLGSGAQHSLPWLLDLEPRFHGNLRYGFPVFQRARKSTVYRFTDQVARGTLRDP